MTETVIIIETTCSIVSSADSETERPWSSQWGEKLNGQCYCNIIFIGGVRDWLIANKYITCNENRIMSIYNMIWKITNDLSIYNT